MSFHESGICRRAFTTEYETPKTLPDRLMQRWTRAAAQPNGTGHWSYATAIKFPTNYLSTTFVKTTHKEITWVTAAPADMTTTLEFFFTRESQQTIESQAAAGGRTLIRYTPLPNGEVFVITTFVEDWAGQDMVIPASHGTTEDFVISPLDLDKTGRPVRMTLFKDATLTQPLVVTEYGAYEVPEGTGLREGMGVLTRNSVIDGNWKKS